MSIVEDKVKAIINGVKSVNGQAGDDCSVENREDGSALIYGPFPSFLILVEEVGTPKALIHVNADAPNLAYMFVQLQAHVQIDIDGAFAVDADTGNLLIGPEAYKKKEENILMFANDIVQRRSESKEQGILVPEKKIILS